MREGVSFSRVHSNTSCEIKDVTPVCVSIEPVTLLYRMPTRREETCTVHPVVRLFRPV